MSTAERPHYVFVTGHLAYENLVRELEALDSDAFSWDVVNIGVKVAALLTPAIVRKRLGKCLDTIAQTPHRVLLPGLYNGECEELSDHFGIAFDKGPKDLRDLPVYFGKKRAAADLSICSVSIFAEIVDAPHRSVDSIVERALYYRSQGADVIDIGCLPGHAFPHLEEAVQALKAEGLSVSVDSLDTDELLLAGRTGADYLLSLTEETLWIADECAGTPVLIPTRHGEPESLYRAIDLCQQRDRAFMADPVLDPLLMGFTESVVRYHALRQRYPDVGLFMGIGNVSELTEADTCGMNTVLLAIAEELGVSAVLSTEVSQHACRAIREADLARRVLHAARRDGSIAKRYHDGLMCLHDVLPFPYDAAEITRQAGDIRDANYRIQLSEQGIHLYNRDTHVCGTDAYGFRTSLDLADDWTHAFYLGVELSRAETAWTLGKRYLQDNPLDWGVADRTGTSPFVQDTPRPAKS